MITRKITYLLSILFFGNLADNASDPKIMVWGLEVMYGVLLAVEAVMLSLNNDGASINRSEFLFDII